MTTCEEVDDSCIAIMYSREKKRLLDEMDQLRFNLEEIGTSHACIPMGFSIEEFIREQTKKSLQMLKDKYYPKVILPPNQRSHLWIGVNPPPNSVSLKTLWDQFQLSIMKYKWLTHFAVCVESHTKTMYRPHLHLMVVCNEKPNRVITTLSNHFAINRNCIECKSYKHGILYGEHLDYIEGRKTEEKEENVQQDKVERESLGIPHFVNQLENYL